MGTLPLFVLKIVLSAGMVITVTFTAERVSPRLAGVMVGFPLGAGLTLFFIGIEQGPRFAAESSLWSIEGILALLGFCWCYRKGTQIFAVNTKASLVLSCLLGLVGYVATATAVRFVLPDNPLARTLIVVLFLFLPAVAFRKAALSNIKEKAAFSWGMIVVRAVFAAFVILSVTGLASFLGPSWSGLLAAFPTVILPSVMILHFHYGGESVPAFFRDTPLAMPAIIVFSLAVHWTFPAMGVWGGTFFSYGFALFYLMLYECKLRTALDRILPYSAENGKAL